MKELYQMSRIDVTFPGLTFTSAFPISKRPGNEVDVTKLKEISVPNFCSNLISVYHTFLSQLQ